MSDYELLPSQLVAINVAASTHSVEIRHEVGDAHWPLVLAEMVSLAMNERQPNEQKWLDEFLASLQKLRVHQHKIWEIRKGLSSQD